MIYFCRYFEDFETAEDQFGSEPGNPVHVQRQEAAAQAIVLTVYVRQRAARENNSDEGYAYDRAAFACLSQWINDVEAIYDIRNSRCYPSRSQCKTPNEYRNITLFGGPFSQQVELQSLLLRWELEMQYDCGGKRVHDGNWPGIRRDTRSTKCRHPLVQPILLMAADESPVAVHKVTTVHRVSRGTGNASALDPLDLEEEDGSTPSDTPMSELSDLPDPAESPSSSMNSRRTHSSPVNP